MAYYNPFSENWVKRTERLFRDVKSAYPEYWQMGMMDMIRKFADDEFYHYHYLAKAYLVYCEMSYKGAVDEN